MYKVNGKLTEKIEPTTFTELNITESDIEEILRKNIDVICDEEESMIIIGSQVQNRSYGRTDLVALDDQGNIVLIEIKRDKQDIQSRREKFEFQAIRYAASFATIQSRQELIDKIFLPYINKYKNEFKISELTTKEFANRLLDDFLIQNKSESSFNEKQRIILAASSFDEQTLSAVSWLSSNNIDISCYQLTPYKLDEDLYIKSEKILPIAEYTDYYVDLLDKKTNIGTNKKTIRKNLPRIKDMLSWGIVKSGDILIAKDYPESKAILTSSGNVMVDNDTISMSKWLVNIYGWSSIQSYVFAIHEKTGKTLSELRMNYMEDSGLL